MTAEELRASIKEEYPDQFYYEIKPPITVRVLSRGYWT